VGAGYPTSDPSVVSVGGTSLTLNSSSNTIVDESAWDLSGGGAGIGILRPSWQTAPTVPSGKYREVPDVSFLADENTGVAMYWKRQWIDSGGTSLGAPAWAAAWAVMAENASKSGKTLPAGPATFYKLGTSSAYTTALHDITSGSNDVYDATTGWDAVTGWGTPDVARLANVITAIPTT
jgi:kumamolisin